MVGTKFYRDRKHKDQVGAKMLNDERMGTLWRRSMELISQGTGFIMGEFNRLSLSSQHRELLELLMYNSLISFHLSKISLFKILQIIRSTQLYVKFFSNLSQALTVFYLVLNNSLIAFVSSCSL